MNSSCFEMTHKLWNFNNYVEDFQFFFVSQDKKYVVFVGEKFHYVFDDYSEILEKILALDATKSLFIDNEESYIEVDKNNNIRGYIVFDVFRDKLNPQFAMFLQSLGFYNNPDGMTNRLVIRGKRYHASDKFNDALPSLDQKYPIEIHIKLNRGEDLIATLLSPLTITIDGIVMIGEMALNPIYD